MNKNYTIFILIFLILLPIFVFAQLVPACPEGRECGYEELLKLIKNIIDFIIMISVPVSAGVFAWAGFKYMTTGISDQKSEAKTIMTKVFLGFVFILSSWLIVSTVIGAILEDTSILPINF